MFSDVAPALMLGERKDSITESGRMLSGMFLTSVFCLLKEEKFMMNHLQTNAKQNHDCLSESPDAGFEIPNLGRIFRASGPCA